MKVKICGICGGNEVIYNSRADEYWCLRCKREIIPLVTPQEEK